MSESLSSRSPSPVLLPAESPSRSNGIPPQIHDSCTYMRNNLTSKEKWFIVGLTALVAMLSTFTSNIYLPTIPTLARAFNKSIELINLTVTVYVIFQGISPVFWGTASDNVGRRPIAAACLTLLTLSCIGLALVPTSDYWLLLVLRCVQAAGAASTLPIGAGVISDISTPAERGGFYGFFSIGPMVGPALGPVVGGALTQGLGWRAMFWFLCISVSLCLVVLIILLPETLPSRQHTRSKFKYLYIPLLPIIGRKSSEPVLPSPMPLSAPKPQKYRNPLPLFMLCDMSLLFVINAVSFTVYFAVTATLSTLFEKSYPFLNQLRSGLCFLAIGGGMTGGSIVNGKFMDHRYQVEKERFRRHLLEKKLVGGELVDVDKLPEFPIEQARLSIVPAMVIILAGCTAGYGWCLHKPVHIAVPLVLHVIMGCMCMAAMNGTATLMLDLVPGRGSAVISCNNLVRGAFIAVIVSVIQPIINAIGVGWAYVLLSGFALTSLPLLYVEFRLGPRYRAARMKISAVEQSSHDSVQTYSEGGHASQGEDKSNMNQ